MSHLRRLCALVAAGTLLTSGLVLVSGPAQAAVDPRPVAQGADWLAGQLDGGLMHNDQYDFDDYGLSIDTALALDAVGGRADTVATIGRAVRDRYYSYTSGADWGTDDLYAGATAKALVLAQVASTGPLSYRSAVTADLEGRVATAGAITGRIEDFVDPENPWGADYANVIGQAFAARALSQATSTRAADALAFLLDQQCAAGYFREQFTADKDSASQSCDAASGSASLDTTALAVVNLEAISGEAGVAAALADARAWLTAQQNPDGSFGNPANANSTGIAAWALGDTPASQDAAAWLRGLQADDADACTALATDIGAIAFDADALATGRSDGIVASTRDQWRRASAQALPALQYLQDAPDAALQLAGPTGFLAAGSTASYQVSGAAAGSRVCLTLAGTAVAGTASGSGTATLVATMPAGTADRTVTVVGPDGSSASTLSRVLGATKLVVNPARKRVERKHRVRVVVTGLVQGERVVLRFRGATVRTGQADADGRFVKRIRVGKVLGKARIVALGEFGSIRKGRAIIRVVR